MAVMKPRKPYVYNRNHLEVANLYSRPAMNPLYTGVLGYGQAGAYNASQFQYTLEQMAASPFAVNNEAYMERIRKEYAYKDAGIYDTFGIIGGVVGAGVSSLLSSGVATLPALGLKYKNPISKRFWSSNTINPKSGWTGELNPKRTAFHNSSFSRMRLISDNKKVYDKYDALITNYNKVNEAFLGTKDALVAAEMMDKDANLTQDIVENLWTKYKYRNNSNAGKKALQKARKAYYTADDAARAANITGDTLRSAGITTDIIKTGSKAATKGTGLVPYIGATADLASLGLSIAGLSQSIEQKDLLNIGLNSLALLGDSVAVAGSAMEIAGYSSWFTGVGAGVGVLGTTISTIGGVVSLGVSAIQGWLVGQTLGKSLSPEGAKAQEMFIKNLNAGIINRPISTLAAAVTMLGVPVMLNSMASGRGAIGNIPGIHGASQWLTTSALGNQARAGLSMMALQGVSAFTGIIDDALPWAPDNPEDVSFVSAISLYGDINDNLYGATRNKAILLGLVSGNSADMIDAMARSWGYSDEIYKSVMFDDIREAAGVDIGNLGNSLISTLGELIIDPQNFNEAFDKYSTTEIVKSTSQLINRVMDYEAAKIQTEGGIAKTNDIGKLVDNHGIFAHKYGADYRRSQMQRLVHSYIKEGPEGVRKLLMDLTGNNVKDATGKAEYRTIDIDVQYKAIVKMFNEIFTKGTFKYNVGSDAQKTAFQKAYNKYKRIKGRKDLDDESRLFVRGVTRTLGALKEVYKDRADESTLVAKFIQDMDITIDTKNAAIMYSRYAGMRAHMDTIDTVATAITHVTNPVSTAIKGLRFAVGKWVESRRTSTSTKMQAETITNLEKLITNIDTIYKNPQISEALNNKDDVNKSNDTLDDMFKRVANLNEHLDKILSDKAELLSEDVKKEYADIRRDIEESKRLIEKRKRTYEKDKALIDLAPIEYLSGSGIKVRVNKDTLKDIQKEIKLYKDAIERTGQTIEEVVKRRFKNDDLKKYLAQNSAVTYYLYHTKYSTAVNKVLSLLHTANGVMSDTASDLNKTLINLLRLVNVYKAYTNVSTTTAVPGTNVKIKEATMDVSKLLQDYFSKDTKALDELDKIAAMFGIDAAYYYEDAQGVTQKGASLKTILLGKLKVKGNIDIEYRPTLQQAVTKAIYKTLKTSDVSLLMAGIVKVPVNITKPNWRKWDAKKRIDTIRELINKTNLVTEDNVAEVLSGDVLNKIYTNINKIMMSDGIHIERVQLQDLTEAKLQEIVYGKMYGKGNSLFRDKMNAAIKLFTEADKELVTLLQSKKGTDAYEEFKNVLQAEINLVNTLMRKNPTYEFFKSYMYSGRVVKEDISLFMSADVDREILPRIPTKNEVKKIRGTKAVYTETDYINTYKEGTVVKYLLNTRSVTEEAAYILNKHNDNATAVEQRAVTKSVALKEIKSRRKLEQARKERIKGRVDTRLENSKASIVNKIKKKNMFNLIPSIKHSTVVGGKGTTKTVKYVKGILSNKYTTKVVPIEFGVVPSKYIDHNTKDISKLTDYFKVLKVEGRVSKGHYDYVIKMFGQMLDIGDNIKFDWKYLNRVGLKRYPNEVDQAFKVRVLAENYKRGRKISTYVEVNKKQESKYKEMLYKSMYTSVEEYMSTHTNSPYLDIFQLNKDLGFEEEDIDVFIENLINDPDGHFKAGVYEGIFKDAIAKTNEALLTNSFNRTHKKISSIMASIRAYEQKDIVGLSDRYYTLARDVVKAMIIGDAKYDTLIKDIMNYGKLDFNNDTDINKLEVPLFQVMFLLNKYIETDRASKLKLDPGKVTDYGLKNDEVIFTIKTDTGVRTINMFTMLLEYHVNIKDIYGLRIRVGKNKDIKVVQDINNRIEIEYNGLINKYGNLLIEDIVDIPKEAYLRDSTEEDYNLLVDPQYNYLQRSLSLDTFLNTRKRSKAQKDFKANIAEYLKENVTGLYTKATKDILNKKIQTIDVNGKQVAKPKDPDALFALYIMGSKMPEETKQGLFREIFFYKHQVSKGFALDRNITKLQKRLKHSKKILDGFKKNPDKYKVRIKRVGTEVKDLTERISAYTRIQKIAKDAKLKDPVPFFKFLKANPSSISSIIHSTYSTDFEDYAMAFDVKSKKYVVVKRKDINGKLNVNDKNVKGLPNYNTEIGENIIDENDIVYANRLTTHLKATMKGSFEGASFEVRSASDYGITIVTDNKDVFPERVINKIKATIRETQGVANIGKVFILTDEEHGDITKMHKIGKYVNVYKYTTKVVNGKILGEVNPNIINVKGSKVRIEKYLNDINKLISVAKKKKMSIDETVDEFLKYSELKEKHTAINKGTLTNVAFNSSSVYKQLEKDAELEAAFMEFLKYVGADTEFDKYSIDVIANLFFKDEYIRRNSNGDLFDLSKLEDKIDTVKLAELKGITVGSKTLLENIRTALEKMQTKYNASEMSFDFSNVLNQDFLRNLNNVRDTVYDFMHKLKRGHKLHTDMMHILKRKHKEGLEWYITPDEMRERQQALLEVAPPHAKAYIKPYGPNKINQAVKTIIKMQDEFDKKKDGVTLQHRLVSTYKTIRAGHKKKNAHKNARKLGKIRGINYYSLKKLKDLHSTKNTESLLKELDVNVKISDSLKKDIVTALKSTVGDPRRLFMKGMDTSDTSKVEEYIDMFKREVIDTYVDYSLRNIQKVPFMELVMRANFAYSELPESNKLTFNEYYQKLLTEQKDKTKTARSEGPEYFRNIGSVTMDSWITKQVFPAGILDFLSPESYGDLQIVIKELLDAVEYTTFKDKQNYTVDPKTLKEIVPSRFKSIQEYLDSIKDIDVRNATAFFVDIEILKKTTKGYDIAELLTKHNLKDKDFDGAWVRVQGDVFQQAYDILRAGKKHTNRKFENNYEVYHLMGISLLDDNIIFKEAVHDYLFAIKSMDGKSIKLKADAKRIQVKKFLSAFGLEYEEVESLFRNYKTMDSIVSVIQAKFTTTSKMYAFTRVLNELKIQFLFKELGSKWNFKDARYTYRDIVVQGNMRAINDVEITNALGRDYKKDKFDNSVINSIDDSLNFINDARSYADSMNDKLKMVRIPKTDTVNEVIGIDPKYILTAETKMNQVTRNIQRRIYSNVMSKQNSVSPMSKIQHDLNNALADVSFDIIDEDYADDVTQVQSKNKVYNELRELFTDFTRHMRKDFKEKDFIRMQDIGIAFQVLKADNNLIGAYKEELGRYISLIPKHETARIKGLDASLKGILNKFESEGFLANNVKEGFIRGVLGYIIVNKYNVGKAEFADRQERMFTYIKKHLRRKSRLAKQDINNITTMLSGVQDVQKLVNKMYPKESLAAMTPTERKEAEKIIEATKDLKMILLNDLSITNAQTEDTMLIAQSFDDSIRIEETPLAIDYTNTERKMAELETIKKRIVSSQGGLKSSFKFALSDTTVAEEKLKEVEDNVAATTKAVEDLEESYIKLLEDRRNKKQEYLQKIFMNNPTLIKEFIEDTETFVRNKTLAAQKEVDGVRAKKDIGILKEYDRRKALELKRDTLIQSDEGILFRRVRSSKFVTAKDTFNTFKNELAILQITSVAKYKKWYEFIENSIDIIDRDLEATPKIISAKGNTLKWIHHYKGLKKSEDITNKRIDGLDAYLAGFQGIADLKGATLDKNQFAIINRFIYSIDKKYKDNITTAKKNVFETETVGKLTKRDITEILETTTKFKDRVEAQLDSQYASLKLLAGITMDGAAYENIIDAKVLALQASTRTLIRTPKPDMEKHEDEYKTKLIKVHANIAVDTFASKMKIERSKLSDMKANSLRENAIKKSKHLKTSTLLAKTVKDLNNMIKYKPGYTYTKSEELPTDVDTYIDGRLDFSIDKVHNAKVRKDVVSLEKLKANISKTRAALENNNKIVEALDKAKPTSVKKLLMEASNEIKIDNPTINTMDVVTYLSDSDIETMNETLVASRTKIKEAKVLKDKARLRQASYYTYTKGNIAKTEKIQGEIDELSVEAQGYKDSYDKLVEARLLEKPHSNSNLGTYMNLYGFKKGETPEEVALIKEQVLQDVINRTSGLFKGGKETLEELIKDASVSNKVELHNPIMDAIITRLNYVAQMKKLGRKIPEAFIVLDMETIKNNYGVPTPYQMTLVKQVMHKGSPVIKIVNQYISNQMFVAGTEELMQPDGAILITKSKQIEDFYEQQWKIAIKENPTAVRADVDAITAMTIEKVKGQGNDLLFVKTFVDEMNAASKNTPIIAHNGESFDFVYYDKFIQRIANTLLNNMYHKAINSMDADTIEAKLRATGLDWTSKDNLVNMGKERKLIEQYHKAIQEVRKKYNRGMEVTANELDMIDKFYSEILKIMSLKVIKDTQESLSIIQNVEVKEALFTGVNSQIDYINELFFNYVDADTLVSKESIKHELVQYFTKGFSIHSKLEQYKEIEKWVTEELLEKSEKEYLHILSVETILDYNTQTAYESYHNTVVGTVNDALGISKENNSTLAPAKMITNFEVKLKQILQHIEYLKSPASSAPGERSTQLRAEQKDLLDTAVVLEDRISEITTKIVDIENLKEEYIRDIQRATRVIQNFTDTMTYDVNIAVNRELALEISKRDLARTHTTNLGLIQMQMDEQVRGMNIAIKDLTEIANILKTTDIDNEADVKKVLESPKVKAMLEKTLEPEVIKAKSEAAINKLIKGYTDKITNMSKLVTKINKGSDITVSKELTTLLETKLTDVIKDIKTIKDIRVKDLQKSWNKYIHRFLPKANNKIDLTDKDITVELKGMYDSLLTAVPKWQGNTVFNTLLTNTSTTGGIHKVLEVLNTKDTTVGKLETRNISSMVAIAIQKDIAHYEHSIDILKNKTPGDDKSYNASLKSITNKFNEILSKVEVISNVKKEIEYEDIFNILQGRANDITIEDYEGLKAAATKRKDKQFIKDMNVKRVERAYNDYNEGINKSGIGLNPDVVFNTVHETDNGNIITVSVPTPPDKFGNTYVQQYTYNTKYPTKGTVKLAYYYTETDTDLIYKKPLVIERKIKPSELKKLLKTLYIHKDKDGKTVRGLTGLRKENIFTENGIDDAYESINKLVETLKSMQKKGAFKYYKEEADQAKAMKAALEGTVNDKDMKDTSLVKYDLSKLLRHRFYSYLDVIQYAKRKENAGDIHKVYRGIVDTVMSKFSSNDPGKHLNLIPADYSTNYIAKWTAKRAYELGMNLELSAEGSAGSATNIRTQANADKLHTFNTNAIRSILSLSKMHLNYTPIGAINETYVLEDADPSKTFEEHITDYVNKQKGTKKKKLTELLLETYKDDKVVKQVNTYTPNILTQKQFDMYEDDVLHKIGLNLQVGFIDHPDAFEDTLLIDSADARALGWDEGNKTWLGLYGFKGGVKYVEGLRAKFGVSIIGSKSSIQERGAYGAMLDQALDTIRMHMTGAKKVPALKQYNAKLKKMFNVTKGKLILDPGTDYDVVLSELFKGVKGKWRSLIDITFKEDLKVEFVDISKPNSVGEYNFKGMNMYKGGLYVIMDADHTADHMSTKTELTEAGEIKLSVKDIKGSVRGGVSMSPSVTDVMETKDVDWQKALLGGDYKGLSTYSNIYHYGFKKVLAVHGVKDTKGEYNVAETIGNIKDLFNNILVDDIETYLLYKNKLETLKDPREIEQIEVMLEEMENRARNKALEIIHGNTGVMYESIYRRHDGVRQQLLANLRLGQGEIRTSKDGWEAFQDLKGGFLEYGKVDKTIWKKLINGFDIKSAKAQDLVSNDGTTATVKNKKKFIDYLNSIGVTNDKINGVDHTMYTEKDGVFTFENFGQKYGWVVAARSPVQDYNAVPMLKVIGYHTHHAVEANAYLYKLIGGDNDGDTIGMLAVDSHKEIEPGVTQKTLFKNLDATEDNYYDHGYIEKINKKMQTSNKRITFDNVDLRYSSVGKHTFKEIRTHYTWGEIYGSTFDSIQKDIDDADVSKANIKWNNDNRKFFLNVAIRKLTKGANTIDGFKIEDYDNPAKVAAMFKRSKILDIASKYYIFDKLVGAGKYDISKHVSSEDFKYQTLHLSKADNATIREVGIENIMVNADKYKELFLKVANSKVYTDSVLGTVERIQTSKRGINLFGGNRKNRVAASILSRYNSLNRDPEGNVWDPFRGSNGNLTTRSLVTKLLSAKHIAKAKKMNKSKFISLAKKEIGNIADYYTSGNTETYKDMWADDMIKVLGDIHTTINESVRVTEELTSLKDVYDSTDQIGIVAHFNKYYPKDLNVFYKDMLEKITEDHKDHGTVTLSESDKMFIDVFYFGKNIKVAENFTKDKNVKKFIKKAGDNYLDQIIIDRRKLGVQSEDASTIIGLAKHAGRDIDKTVFYNNYNKKVGAKTAEESIRKVTTGVDRNHSRSLAIAMDSNPFEKNGVRISDEVVKARREALNKDMSNTQRKDYYNNETDARINLTKRINEYAKAEFFNDAHFADSIYYEVSDVLEAITKAFNAELPIKQILDKKIKVRGTVKTVNEYMQTLLTYNIPAYRVLRVLTTSYSLYRSVNDTYHLTNHAALSKDKIPFIAKGYGLFAQLITLKSKHERTRLDALLGDEHQAAKDFLLNNKDVDYEYLTMDLEGNVTRKTNTVSNNSIKVPAHYSQEMLSNLSTGSDARNNVANYTKMYNESTPLEQKLFTTYLEEKGIKSIRNQETLDDLLENVKTEFSTLRSIHGDKAEQYDDGIKKLSSNDIKIKIANRNKFSYHNVGNSIREITTAYTMYKQNEQELKELSAELLNIRGKIIHIKDDVTHKDKAIAYIDKNKDVTKHIADLNAKEKEVRSKIKKMKEITAKAAFSKSFSKGTFLLHDPKGRTIFDLYENAPKYIGDDPEFTSKDVQKIKDTNLMNMQKYQTPFLTMASLFKNDDDTYDWDKLFDYYRGNRKFLRLTVVMDAYDNETLVRNLGDQLRKNITEYDNKSNWAKMMPWNIYKHRKTTRFDSFEDIIKYVKDLNKGITKEDGIKINGKRYKTVDLNGIDFKDDVSPTLKEINIKTPEDFARVLKMMEDHMKNNNTTEELSIGFVTLDDFMSSYDIAYKPARLEGKGMIPDLVSSLQYSQKLMMRLSLGFLFRNYMDTWTQIYSELYTQEGLYGTITKAPEILRITGLTGQLYKLYQDVYEERLTVQIDIKSKFEEMQQVFTRIKNNHGSITHNDAITLVKNLVDIRNRIYSYTEGVKKLNNVKSRIKHRSDRATKVLKSLDTLMNFVVKDIVGFKNLKEIEKIEDPTFRFKAKEKLQVLDGRKDIKDSAAFILNINFAEYLTLHDSLMFDPSTPNKPRKRIKKWMEKYNKDKGKKDKPIYNDVEHILFEISAFMQTNAQIDTYKQEHYTYLRRIVEKRVSDNFNNTTDKTYEEVSKEVNDASRTFENKLAELAFQPYKLYANMNETIENTARIGGFLFDRYLYGYSFNETVNRSLKRWFNYGQRTPVETQLLADIPYLSFPIRTVDNWLDRMLDPSYNRLISDIVDGVYGQYADEDGQYDQYEQFQIMNGWLPVGGGVGLRLGFGLYDVQNILNNTAATIEQRRNPILRSLHTLATTKDVGEAMKNLATVGVLTRSANTLGPRNVTPPTPGVRKPVQQRERTLGNTFNFLYNYSEGNNKYTPYKYRNNNGRYKRYENIYKNWFNKYGRMRQPKVDPIGLVKDIQWKQYVRHRQSQAMR